MSSTKIPKTIAKNFGHFTPQNFSLIEKAYLFARAKHKGQKRKSGSPFIIHPLKVAAGIARDNYGHITTVAALLHDTLEDTETTYGELNQQFGEEVANLVSGVTKISALRTKSKSLVLSDEEMFINQVDNYRKIILATVADIRVMIIRLYDRLDNISTLEWIKPEKRRFYARETIEIYAPIAERLGMGFLKGRLEDLSFPYAYPEEYEHFKPIAKQAYKNTSQLIDEITPVIIKRLKASRVRFYDIAGRAKHLYSLYFKIKQDNRDISTIFDIIALRIIVGSIEDCYKVLGLVHDLYTPLPNRIHDYIAQPKGSGYQSLHTTVKNEAKHIFEIQIRTREMHEIAEFGPAAHWGYKDRIITKNLKLAEKNRQEWLSELQKIRHISNEKDFIKQIKEEFFSKQVFIFTPKGKIIKLPTGACCIDFAYQIHSDLGNSCSGAKINGRIMPLSTQLRTGDMVEIITSKKTGPSRDWLKITKTSSAKHHIRNALRRKNYASLLHSGEIIISNLLRKYKLPRLEKNQVDHVLNQARMPYKDSTSALVAIGEGILNKFRFLKLLYPGFNSSQRKAKHLSKSSLATISSLKDIRHIFAGCCHPKASDNDLIGYLAKDHVIKIHKRSCKSIIDVDQRRLINIDWFLTIGQLIVTIGQEIAIVT